MDFSRLNIFVSGFDCIWTAGCGHAEKEQMDTEEGIQRPGTGDAVALMQLSWRQTTLGR